MKSFIVPYFEKLNYVFKSETNNKKYKVGIYAPRYICSYISKEGLAEYSFVADMSSGYSCNLGYRIPKNWAFDQFFEFNERTGGQFPSSPSFDLDKVGYSGSDKGITTFDKVDYMSPDELAEKNSDQMIEEQKDQFVCNILEKLGYLNKVVKSNIVYEKESTVAAIPTDGCTIFVSYKSSHTFTPDNEFSKKPIYIEMDNTGLLTTTCDNQIKDLTAGLEIQGKDIVRILDGTVDSLREVAISMKAGKIGMKVGVKDNCPVYTILFTTKDILPDRDTVDYEMTTEINFKIMPSISGDGKQPKYEIDWEKVKQLAIIIALVGCIVAGGNALPLLGETLIAQGILKLSEVMA